MIHTGMLGDFPVVSRKREIREYNRGKSANWGCREYQNEIKTGIGLLMEARNRRIQLEVVRGNATCPSDLLVAAPEDIAADG